MKTFIENMPKAELHVHLEGTLEPEHIFALAQRNKVELEYETPQEVIAAYDFHDLPFSGDEVIQLSRNAFDIAWLEDVQKQAYITALDSYARESS